MKPRSTKQHDKRWYAKKCDEEFSKIVRQKGACEKCGSTTSLQCAHVVGRTNRRLRWDLCNALCLCYACHIHWAHKEPLEFSFWFHDRYPARYWHLLSASKKPIKRTLADYQELYESLLTYSIH